MFAASGDPGHVFSALSAHYTVIAEAPTTLQWTCLDTADWRLHRAGMTLRHTRRGSTAELVLDSDDRPRVAVPTRISGWPRRIDALPDSEVRDIIGPAVGLRALLPLAEVGVRSIPLRLLDDVEKTRVRLRVDQQRLIGNRPSLLPLRVLITPLRGYEKDAQHAEDVLTAAFAQFGEATHATTVAFRAAGHEPGEPALARPRLDPAAPAPEEIAKVLRHWTMVLDAVRPAVVQDVDVECLREFRGAARNCRALLVLTASSLPSADLDRYVDEFAWLADLAAPVRAADVLELEIAGRGALDVDGLAHLDVLAEQVHSLRRKPMRDLRAALGSSRLQEFMSRWQDALERLERGDVIGASLTASFARTQSEAAFRRVVQVARLVDASSSPADLAALRTRLRTWRVVLDTFEGVYTDDDLVAHVKAQVNDLHERLGVVADSAAAIDGLTAAARRLAHSAAPVEVLLDAGALADRARARETDARARLGKPLRRFVGKKLARAADTLTRTA
jgi:CHAD domain-containing protein